ncbi:glutaredoxin domain-containing cysteine-rich protein CG31559-like [Culex pipiens pallens]|uniref:glutaredoxin domain-containing cysteine-rich protein CG31559-like n=1 Tax=Culex pipiens pallens TaxID=42434 RepID=UPI001952C405|nr:glutaredoxin domain-containing cysteine-rich protein CG31559-like [Culex pipiens pallens]
MDSTASMMAQTLPHRLTSIQISAETTVYASLDSSLAALQKRQHVEEVDAGSGTHHSLPPAVELLRSTTGSVSEKVVLPEKEERESSVEVSSHQDQQADSLVVVDASRSSGVGAVALAVGAGSCSSLETVQEKPSSPVFTDQESHVVRIQIVQKEEGEQEKISSALQSVTPGTAVISVNQNVCGGVQNQCKAKVSIVSFGPPEDPRETPSLSPTPSVEMVQKQASPSSTPTSDVNGGGGTYLYYMMSSGQCSPSDTLDSGTCSDIEVTPPPLPKKMSKSPQPAAAASLMMISSPSPVPPSAVVPADKPLGYQRHQRAGSSSYTSTSDSDESESSLSCDSLNFTQLCGNVTSLTLSPNPQTPEPLPTSRPLSQTPSSDHRDAEGSPLPPTPPPMSSTLAAAKKQKIVSILPDSLLKDIRERSASGRAAAQIAAAASEVTPPREDITTTTRSILMEKINSLNSVADGNTAANLTAAANNNNKSLSFENDKFYKFHINEHSNLQERNVGGAAVNGFGSPSCGGASSVVDDDESFAGFRDLTSGTSTIRSNKGTVRGVKNRVRNGIATFLQMQQANLKNYKEKDGGKVVVYTTSMGIVRETYTKCANVKQILRTLLVKFEERDVFMSSDYQQEIKDRMQSELIQVPQVFVDGQHVGDAECIERLNESGELRKMLKPYKCLESSFTCKTCGGYRLLPCPSCGGSKKSIHRNHFTAEFIALKCMNCDEVGLVKCHNC